MLGQSISAAPQDPLVRPLPPGLFVPETATRRSAGRDSPPVELPVDRVDLSSSSARARALVPHLPPPSAERRDSNRLLADKSGGVEREEKRSTLSTAGIEVKNQGISFEILEKLHHAVQSNVVDRRTQDVIMSVPDDRVVRFREIYRSIVGAHVDLRV